MAIKFDPNKQYQQDAIKSIIDLFKGQPSDDSSIPIQLNSTGQTSLINGVSNSLVLTDEQILANLKEIQKYTEQLRQEFEKNQKDENEFISGITKKYGEGSLDPKTFEFTPHKDKK